jgi:hypothetical protein
MLMNGGCRQRVALRWRFASTTFEHARGGQFFAINCRSATWKPYRSVGSSATRKAHALYPLPLAGEGRRAKRGGVRGRGRQAVPNKCAPHPDPLPKCVEDARKRANAALASVARVSLRAGRGSPPSLLARPVSANAANDTRETCHDSRSATYAPETASKHACMR